MSAAVHVRFVTRGDYAEWLPLWEGYNEFYKRFGATALPDAVTQVTWARFFDTYEPMYAMVAVDGARVVGLVHYLWHRSTITIEPTCYLQDLFTAESARGNGVGRALIEAVYEQARLAGVVQVYWRTHATNATARRLYDQVAEESGSLVYKKRIT
jgi:GNAT superfamily N-acetyltransferase